MLTLYHNNQEIPLDTTEYYVRELASGMDEVIFDLSIWDPNYALMQEEESIVDRGGQRYLVKQIDAGAITAKVVCQLDLDEWKASMLVGYDSGSKTVYQQISAVKPTGWTVSDHSLISISRTIKGDLTPLQVCEQCRDIYQVYVRWDNKTKTCHIYKQAIGTPVGAFATRELNLKEINYKGKSTNFATRLYAVGKDGLTFASINDGKAYVDNNTYSSRVICAYWQDDRYTDKASLLNDAREHLAKLAVPERSYDCAIVDLQATNPIEYNNLDFSLFTTATLIDDIKETAIDYMVVERHVWPYHPDLNDVIFNSSPVKIQNVVTQIEDEITNPNSTFQQILEAEIDMVTDWLTDNNSHCYITQNADGTIKDFIFVNGDQPIQTATQVMRINASGLGFSKTGVNGPYTNAFVFDSTKGGHLVADFITAGVLNANLIKAGVLSDDKSRNYWNMKTGDFRLTSSTIYSPYYDYAYSYAPSSSTYPTSQWVTDEQKEQHLGETFLDIHTDPNTLYTWSKVGNVYQWLITTNTLGNYLYTMQYDLEGDIDNLDSSLDQAEVFKRLTDNLQDQGLILDSSTGKVYLNASMMATGILQSNDDAVHPNFKLKLNNGELTANKLTISAPGFKLLDDGRFISYASTPSGTGYTYIRTLIDNGLISIGLCDDPESANAVKILNISYAKNESNRYSAFFTSDTYYFVNGLTNVQSVSIHDDTVDAYKLKCTKRADLSGDLWIDPSFLNDYGIWEQNVYINIGTGANPNWQDGYTGTIVDASGTRRYVHHGFITDLIPAS